jgi:hypothetical protein
MKIFRKSQLIIGIVALIAIGVMAYTQSRKPANERVSMSAYQDTYQKDEVNQGTLQQVKAAFPEGFPFPSDVDVIGANIRKGNTIGGSVSKGGYDIMYVTSDTTEEIIAKYTEVLKEQGLTVVNRPAKAGEQTVVGHTSRKIPSGAIVSDGSYEIGINVANLPNGKKRVGIWLNL